ncbi:acetyl-CoA acetyltransferase [Zymobacter palmae]|uniref:Acetyl-CoA acetyltransferase n=1 Tax=Zymobacter palmae TaxID=33074 RepID=A0A348HHY6_9GAMM|nr:acetyl-CoA acetyltransferase [Zymobacter palmae]
MIHAVMPSVLGVISHFEQLDLEDQRFVRTDGAFASALLTISFVGRDDGFPFITNVHLLDDFTPARDDLRHVERNRFLAGIEDFAVDMATFIGHFDIAGVGRLRAISVTGCQHFVGNASVGFLSAVFLGEFIREVLTVFQVTVDRFLIGFVLEVEERGFAFLGVHARVTVVGVVQTRSKRVQLNGRQLRFQVIRHQYTQCVGCFFLLVHGRYGRALGRVSMLTVVSFLATRERHSGANSHDTQQFLHILLLHLQWRPAALRPRAVEHIGSPFVFVSRPPTRQPYRTVTYDISVYRMWPCSFRKKPIQIT